MRLTGLMLAALLTASSVAAQDRENDAIQDVIDSQMQAFRSGDAASAFTFASPMIQSMFGTPDNFGLMVQRGYPMIWNSAAVDYLGVREVEGRTVQRIRVRDAAGDTFLFDYEMIEGPEGWKINGVYPVREEDVGV
jgi:hypothetical protein